MKKVLLLSSSLALGVYVPAKMLQDELRCLDTETDIHIVEGLFQIDKKINIEVNKRKFGENFKLAKAAHTMPNHFSKSIDETLKEQCFKKWNAGNYSLIIVMSGFWLDLVYEYDWNYAHNSKIILLHLDSAESHSWHQSTSLRNSYKEMWFFSESNNQINYKICTRPYIHEENKSIIVHGGGWNMGEYKDAIRTMNQAGYRLSVIVNYIKDIPSFDIDNDYYVLQANFTYDLVLENPTYPCLMRFINGKLVVLQENNNNPFADLINSSCAIISKPGGGTLIDSLTYGIPLIFTEELAKYELCNAQLWVRKGLGMLFEEFIKLTDKKKHLLDMRRNIINLSNILPEIGDFLNE